MDQESAKRLQARLGVRADGVIGRGTLGALFAAAGASQDRASELGLAGALRMLAYGILDTPLRLAHFMAQLGHESGNFKYMEEIASGRAYEGRADLGNIHPGDGVRFKGRGPIQLTGRENYRFYGRMMGIDLERHPEIAAVPSIGLWTACLYWENRRINGDADRDDLEAVTRKVNGGLNGLASRKMLLGRMKALML